MSKHSIGKSNIIYCATIAITDAGDDAFDGADEDDDDDDSDIDDDIAWYQSIETTEDTNTTRNNRT